MFFFFYPASSQIHGRRPGWRDPRRLCNAKNICIFFSLLLQPTFQPPLKEEEGDTSVRRMHGRVEQLTGGDCGGGEVRRAGVSEEQVGGR